jgi:hypothetical protein
MNECADQADSLPMLSHPGKYSQELEMGTSFTSYRGKGFWARDGQVEVWLYLLVQEIDRLESAPDWLVEVRQDWHVNATLGLTGCVSAGLDEIATTKERVEVLIALAGSALAWLSQQGPRLTLDIPYSHGTGGPDRLCENVDVRVFGCVGEKFIELLQGKVETDARTSPCVWPDEG